MKCIKLFAVALGLVVFSSCGDDKDYNTVSDVTVEMGQTEVAVKEHKGIFNVPIKVSGDPNGEIKVKVKVEGTGSNPATPFENHNGTWSGNYIISSETLIIPKGETLVNVEISPVDDRIENEDRTFIVTIESVEGARIGALNSTLVVLKDNDSIPYERFPGDWTMTYRDFANVESSMKVSIEGYDEDSKRYGVGLMLKGMWKDITTDGSTAQLVFVYDEESGEQHIEFVIPQTIGTYTTEPQYDIWLVPTERFGGGEGEFNMFLSTTTLIGTISDDINTITFDEMLGFSWYLADPNSFNDQPELPLIQTATNIVLTRI